LGIMQLVFVQLNGAKLQIDRKQEVKLA